jgi:hypothetical protein
MPRPLNYCSACGQDFASITLFDRHLVGQVSAGVYRGPLWEWKPELGIRCLTVEEMEERGWRRNKRGRWQDPCEAERARRLRARSPVSASAVGLERVGGAGDR